MIKDYLIDQQVITLSFSYNIDSNIDKYLQKIGNIKGIKKTKNQIHIYLIEFLNYNRIWMTSKEFKLQDNNN